MTTRSFFAKLDHNKSKSVLVTGGAGFIGSHLVRALIPIESIDRIVVFDNLSTGSIDNVPAHPKVQFINGDLCQKSKLHDSLSNIAIVFHLAAGASIISSIEDPESCFKNNAVGTMHLFEVAQSNRTKRIVIASTSAVYGEQDQDKVCEDDPLKPLSPYASSKLANEAIAEAFFNIYGIESVVLRMFNIYGPGQKNGSLYSSVIPKFLHAVNSGQAVTIYGSGEQTRDFLHVGDAVQALCEAGIWYPGIEFTRVFNIASGKSLSVLELVSMISDVAEKTPSVVMEPARNGEIIRSGANIGRAQQLLKFCPRIPLKYGLAQMWKSMSSQV